MTQQLITISPMDDSVVAQRSYAMPDEIQAAPARAKHAQRAWQNTPLATRAALVTSAFDALGRRRMRSPHWLTLLQMVELFDRDKSVISRHLKNIFDTGELPRGATVAKTATVQTDVAMVKKAICKKCILQRLISI